MATAKCLYLSNNSTYYLEFVYDNITYSIGDTYGTDKIINDIYEVSLNFSGKVSWASVSPLVSGININSSFYGYSGITDISYWFNNTILTSYITGLENINIASVTDMRNTFCGSAITEINMHTWNTSGVKYFDHMFESCAALTTIYVGTGWSTAGYVSYSNMFSGCKQIVGGNGTKYKSTKKHGNMAVIDVSGSPGYLTLYTPTGKTVTIIYNNNTLSSLLESSNVDIIYNNSTIASNITTNKTILCNGKLMQSNLVIGSKTLNCNNKIMASDVTINIE